jgi:hypothetical protein
VPYKDIEKRREHDKEYRKIHREQRKKWQQGYRERHKEQEKEYRESRKELKKEYDKEYFQKNKKKKSEQFKQYNKNRRQIDVNFKLRFNLSARIRIALKLNYKTTSTVKLIGCSLDFLKQYLESQFKRGMSWQNYGREGWHIDHIRPCASFDLSKPSEQFKCFNYTNLQPLWAVENMFKSNKISERIK